MGVRPEKLTCSEVEGLNLHRLRLIAKRGGLCGTFSLTIVAQTRAKHISSPNRKVAMIFCPYEALRGDFLSRGRLRALWHCNPTPVSDYVALWSHSEEQKLTFISERSSTMTPSPEALCRPSPPQLVTAHRL